MYSYTQRFCTTWTGLHIATDMREVRTVRQTGQVNDRFGVYSNACCGYEVVIREGAIFPYCPNCYSPATWHFAETEVNQPIIIQKKSELDPAA